ncbi:MAG TPA: TlpA disulfide reductase family protein [Candidatus Binataceae bacterium]|jgi:peroxiredoxin|nr:TlpA disulfide reductase family protein [Candidatus Binataceae bacterium]
MTRNIRILSVVSGVVILVALAFILFSSPSLYRGAMHTFANQGPADEPPTIAAGLTAPNFTLTGLDGKSVSLAGLRGKVVFLNVWATWCPPCRSEMPSIESLYRAFRQQPDFVTLAVSEDTNPKAAAQYIRKNNFNFPVLLDPRNTVGEAYNVSGLPESFVIGRDGRIVAHHVGPYDWSNPDIRSALEDLLKAKTG